MLEILKVGRTGSVLRKATEAEDRAGPSLGSGFRAMDLRVVYKLFRYVALSALAASFVFAETEPPSFSRDIRPILSGKCFKCHGPDPETREADFRLDRRESAVDAEVIVPGDSVESWIMDVVTSDDPDLRMPPKGDPLTESEVEKIRAWIDAGAEYEAHWAYQEPNHGELPALDESNWPASELDHYVLRKMQEADLSPAPKAQPAVLLRRLYLDLIGLPPSVEEVEAFEADPSEENFEAHVDRLLQSPRFGEKWASGWLDLARYADSNGYQHDDLRTMWPYRDWVVNAFNDDMPFDEFSVEQLAGDLLPKPTRSQLVATGFNRNVPTNFSGGTKVPEVRANVLHDRVATTGAVWLGLTLECAQCHDHKFDEITQKEYYQLYAYFDKAIPEFDQQGDGMFRKHFIGRDVTVYATDAERKEAKELEVEIEREEKRIVALEESTGSRIEAIGEDVVLLDFENPDPFKSHKATRPAMISLIEDTPEGEGKYAARIEAKSVTETKSFFGTGYSIPVKDLSETSEISFWIKTDMESQFNLQVHNEKRRVSAYGFSTIGLEPGKWTKVVAPLGDFKKPQWSSGSVDWARIQKVQITAHGSGPYEGKYIMLDNVRGVTSSELAVSKKRVFDLRSRLAELQTKTMAMQDSMMPSQTRIMLRGDYTAPGDSVETGVLKSLHPLDPELPSNRLGLAQWLVDEENPLTSRVVVNRVWGEIFGRGIVTTPEDFGMQGAAPTHPQLLDWLALRFIEDGWSSKRLIKTIAMSSTYQQSSGVPRSKIEKDPENEWYARGPRFRLSAELIRDNLLAISGLLSNKMGGPSVYPPQPEGLWKDISTADVTHYPTSEGEDRYRRGLYTFLRRGNLNPMFLNFDGANRSTCSVDRDRSNTPVQALNLLNDPSYVEAAQALAALIEELPGEVERKVETVFRRTVARQPSEAEVSALVSLYRKHGDWFSVAQVLLNLDETITKS